MVDAAGRLGSLDPEDQEMVDTCLSVIDFIEIEAALSDLAPDLSAADRADFRGHCQVAHVAALIFPTSVAELIRDLKADGTDVTGPVPSVVVRDRLGLRYGIAPQALPVSILHAQAQGGASVELFVLEPTADSQWPEVQRRERAELNETHLAFDVCTPGNAVAARLHALLVEHGGMTPDSCGYNEFEDCTVLYYSVAAGTPARSLARVFRRLELRIPGHWPPVLELHRRAT